MQGGNLTTASQNAYFLRQGIKTGNNWSASITSSVSSKYNWTKASIENSSTFTIAVWVYLFEYSPLN